MNENKIEKVIARAIVVYQGSVLLVRRSQTDSRSGEWEFPGGTVEIDENLEDAVNREVVEETGLNPVKTTYYQSASYEFVGENRVGVIFIIEVDSDKVVLSNEHDELQWVTARDYKQAPAKEHYIDTLEKFFATEVKEPVVENTVVDKASPKIKVVKTFTDGGSRGNPGPSASGYVILDENDGILEEGGEYLGITTNNQAEYQAVKLALEQARKYQPDEVQMFMDSLLVVNQMTGVYKIKNRDLWPIYEAIKELASYFKKVTFTHVRREYNTMADSQVNIVLDSQEGK